MGKVISFKPRVGKAKTGLSSGGFTVVIPTYKYTDKPLQKNKKNIGVTYLLGKKYQDKCWVDIT